MRSSARPLAPHRRWLLAGAVLVVLVAQWLALVHTVVHGRGPAPATPALELRADAPALLQLVAGHDAGTIVCQWFDHLAQATPGVDVPVPAAAPLPQADLPPAALPALRAATLAAYRARAPPVHA